MDLKQQLVIWKKANYLLDNMVITPVLCEKLIEEGIFTVDMINQVQVRTDSDHLFKSVGFFS